MNGYIINNKVLKLVFCFYSVMEVFEVDKSIIFRRVDCNVINIFNLRKFFFDGSFCGIVGNVFYL